MSIVQLLMILLKRWRAALSEETTDTSAAAREKSSLLYQAKSQLKRDIIFKWDLEMIEQIKMKTNQKQLIIR